MLQFSYSSHSIDCQPSCALRSSPAVMDQGKTLDTTALLGWPACCHIPYLKTRGQTFVCAAAAIEFLGISGCMEHLEHHLECVGIHSAFRERDGKQQAMISLEAFILFMFGGVPACKVLQKNSSKFENVKKVRQFVLDKIAPDLCTGDEICGTSTAVLSDKVGHNVQSTASKVPVKPASSLSTFDHMETGFKCRPSFSLSEGCKSNFLPFHHKEPQGDKFNRSKPTADIGLRKACDIEPRKPLLWPGTSKDFSSNNNSTSSMLNLRVQMAEQEMEKSDTVPPAASEEDHILLNGTENLPDSKQDIKKETVQFECKYCHVVFIQKHDFNLHMQSHKPKKVYFCKYCGKSFHHSSNLTIHLRVHTGEKPFQCKECLKTFSHSSNLRQHMRTHTLEKPFECDFCKKTFASTSQLKSHIRTHTEDKPHRCRQCGKVFAQSSQLQSHMTTHSVERQYPCQYCGKVFKQSGNRNQHLRTHTGSKPFQCQHCDKTFAWSSSYKNHLQSHKSVGTNNTENVDQPLSFKNERAQADNGIESEKKQVACNIEQDQIESKTEIEDLSVARSFDIQQVQSGDESESESHSQQGCYRIELDPMDEMLTVVIPTPLVMVDTE